MKKMLSLLLILLLLEAPAAFAEQPRKNAVTELYSAEGVYTDGVGNETTYSFHVPLIQDDTPAAKEINEEIMSTFGAQVEDEFRKMEGGFSLWSWVADWHAYWNGDQLFLLLQTEENADFSDYAAFGYDFASGSRLTNEMILEQKGIHEEDYLQSLKKKAQSMYEEMYGSLPEKIPEARTAYEEMLEKTLAWQTMEEPMFLNQFGEIETIGKIGSIAGAEWFYYRIAPYASGDTKE